MEYICRKNHREENLYTEIHSFSKINSVKFENCFSNSNLAMEKKSRKIKSTVSRKDRHLGSRMASFKSIYA